jgi:hypothetical protein
MFARYDLPGVLLDSYRTYPRESLIELLTRRLPIAQKVLTDAMRPKARLTNIWTGVLGNRLPDPDTLRSAIRCTT